MKNWLQWPIEKSPCLMGKFPLKDYGTLDFDALKEFLEAKVDQYNTRDFIDSDPIQIPHSFTRKEDIEICRR